MKTHHLEYADIKLSLFESVNDAGKFFCQNQSIYHGALVALNAEKLLKLKYNSRIFDELMNPCFYADGVGALMLVNGAQSRVPGVELWLEILDRVTDDGYSICIIGASENVNSKAVNMLMARYPNLIISGLNGFLNQAEYSKLVELKKPDIAFVAMGSPLQENLISKLQLTKPDTLYMGIGGSLDVFVGNVRRAPKLFRKLNIEFLYRLIVQPTRIFRYTSLLKFLIFYYSGKIK